jgi:hypothetical protein
LEQKPSKRPCVARQKPLCWKDTAPTTTEPDRIQI